MLYNNLLRKSDSTQFIAWFEFKYFPFQQAALAAPSIITDDSFDHGTDDPRLDDYATNFDPLIEALVNIKSNATSGGKNLFVELETIRRSALSKITDKYRKAYESIMNSDQATGVQKQESFAKLRQATNESLDAINYTILKHKSHARSLISTLESNDMIWEIKGILLNASIHQNETSIKLHELSTNVRNDVSARYRQFEQAMEDIEAQFQPLQVSSPNCISQTARVKLSTVASPPREQEQTLDAGDAEKVWSGVVHIH